MQAPKHLFWTEEEMQRMDREGEQIARSLKSKAAKMRFPPDESQTQKPVSAPIVQQ